MKLKRFVYLSLFGVLLCGCTMGSAIITGTPREPTTPESVKVYRKAPEKKYEQIAIVQAESEEIFSQQDALDRAVEELKKQAAKLGANGIILLDTGTNIGSGNLYYGLDEYQSVKGDAIYTVE